MSRHTVLMPTRTSDVVLEGCAARVDLLRLWERTPLRRRWPHAVLTCSPSPPEGSGAWTEH